MEPHDVTNHVTNGSDAPSSILEEGAFVLVGVFLGKNTTKALGKPPKTVPQKAEACWDWIHPYVRGEPRPKTP